MTNNITWRNVDAPNAAPLIHSIGQAGSTINQGLGTLQRTLKDRIDQDNAAAAQAYAEVLGRARTPEELAALQASGQLDQLRSGMDAEVQRQTLGGFDARNTALFNQQEAIQKRTDTELQRQRDPLMGQIAAAGMRGDVAGGQAIIDANTDLLGPKLGEAAKLLHSNNYEQAKYTHGLKGFTTQERKDEIGIQSGEANLARTVADNAATAEQRGREDQARKNAELGETYIQQAASQYNSTKDAEDQVVRDGIFKITGSNNLTIESLTPDQRSALDTYVKTNLKEMSQAPGQVLDAARNYLMGQNLKTAEINTALASLDANIRSRGLGAAQADVDAAKASATSAKAQYEKTNPFALKTGTNEHTAASTKVTDAINDKSYPNSFRYKVEDMRDFISSAMSTGIPIKDSASGKEVMVPIPPAIAQEIISAARDDAKVWNQSAEMFKKKATELLTTKYADQISEAAAYKTGLHENRIAQIDQDFTLRYGKAPGGKSLTEVLRSNLASDRDKKAKDVAEQAVKAAEAQKVLQERLKATVNPAPAPTIHVPANSAQGRAGLMGLNRNPNVASEPMFGIPTRNIYNR